VLGCASAEVSSKGHLGVIEGASGYRRRGVWVSMGYGLVRAGDLLARRLGSENCWLFGCLVWCRGTESGL
jgi:hypothetical protein